MFSPCPQQGTKFLSIVVVLAEIFSHRLGTAYPSGAPEFTIGFKWGSFTRSLVLCVLFCRSLFVLLSLFFWQLYCLSFDYRFVITPLVSSNSSCRRHTQYTTPFSIFEFNYLYFSLNAPTI